MVVLSLGKIIGIFIGIITAIFTIIIVIINWWVEGEVTGALLEAFGVHPIMIVLIGIIGFIVLIRIILEIIDR